MNRFLVSAFGVALMATAAHGALAATNDGTIAFTIKISNVSMNDTLKVPGNAAVKAPDRAGRLPGGFRRHGVRARPDGSAELQTLAEDGNFEPLQKALVGQVRCGGRHVRTGPGIHGRRQNPGDRLSFATMFVQSNDKFYAPAGGGLALFDANGHPVSGDLTGFGALVRRRHRSGSAARRRPRSGAAPERCQPGRRPERRRHRGE
jgi:hypothetical protein